MHRGAKNGLKSSRAKPRPHYSAPRFSDSIPRLFFQSSTRRLYHQLASPLRKSFLPRRLIFARDRSVRYSLVCTREKERLISGALAAGWPIFRAAKRLINSTSSRVQVYSADLMVNVNCSAFSFVTHTVPQRAMLIEFFFRL